MADFARFYHYYLGEHATPACRYLHFVGSSLVLLIVLSAVLTRHWALLWLAPLAGYGFAWIGHFFFEHNRPATFRHPWLSLAADWVMYGQMLRGRHWR